MALIKQGKKHAQEACTASSLEVQRVVVIVQRAMSSSTENALRHVQQEQSRKHAHVDILSVVKIVLAPLPCCAKIVLTVIPTSHLTAIKRTGMKRMKTHANVDPKQTLVKMGPTVSRKDI